MAYILGHDQHGHPQAETAGCAGDIMVPPLDEAHRAAGNIAAVFVASYTDNPGGGETPQQGSDEVILERAHSVEREARGRRGAPPPGLQRLRVRRRRREVGV